MGWEYSHSICGIDELPWHCRPGTTHAISILDPGTPEPRTLTRFPLQERLALRFHDVLQPMPKRIAPKPGHMEMLLSFGRRMPMHMPLSLLVHCHGGVSRSTAAAVALLLQAHPDMDEDQVLARVDHIRPQAWPNSLMIAHADEILGREGRLVRALCRFYRRKLSAKPKLAFELEMGGRRAEVDMAKAA